jgi:hypothetical protein
MKIGIVNRDSFLDNNKIFELGLIPDGIIDFWHYLKVELLNNGILINTIDSLSSAKSCDLLIFNEFPSKYSKKYNFLNCSVRKFLILGDCPLVIPENYNFENYKIFDKVFTWNKNLLKTDKDKFIKINFTLPIKKLINPDAVYTNKTIDVCMISANKIIKGYGELYSFRKLMIEHLEEKDISFHLYGTGWNKIRFSSHNIYGKILNRLTNKITITPPNSWKGTIKSKLDIYEHTSSSFAIENATEFPGYITEKIIHSLLGFTIPLYLGDSNISESIPSIFYNDIKNLNTNEITNLIMENKRKNDLQYRKKLLEFIMNDGLHDFDSNIFMYKFIKFL